MQLRDYQQECIEKCIHHLESSPRQLICLPTGAGKTIIFSHIIDRAKKKAIVLVPRIELIQQSYDKFHSLFPETKASILHGSTKYCLDDQVIFTTIQTAIRRDDLLIGRGFELAIFDEAHHAPADTYEKFIESLKVKYFIGFTATVKRTDRKHLRNTFHEIVYARSISQLIGGGHLAPIEAKFITTRSDDWIKDLDLEIENKEKSHLKMYYGIGDRSVLEARENSNLIMKTYLELCSDRKKGLVFCQSVKHAEYLSKLFNNQEIPSDIISSKTKAKDRVDILNRFKSGKIKLLFNYGILTEGFDCPDVDLIILARVVRSCLSYTQIVGRGTRKAPGKTDCLVVQFQSANEAKIMSLKDIERWWNTEINVSIGNDEPYIREEGDSERACTDSNLKFDSNGKLYISPIDIIHNEEIAADIKSHNSYLDSKHFKKKWEGQPASEKQIKFIKRQSKKHTYLQEYVENSALLTKGEACKIIQSIPADGFHKKKATEDGLLIKDEDKWTIGSLNKARDFISYRKKQDKVAKRQRPSTSQLREFARSKTPEDVSWLRID